MIYSSFFVDIDDDRELKEQTKFVQKQSKQEKRNTKEEIKQEVEKKSKNDSKKCEEVVSAIELSKVKVSFSIKFQTSSKFVKCFLFDLTNKDDFLN
jgi:flagellar biosynthesis protein FliP